MSTFQTRFSRQGASVISSTPRSEVGSSLLLTREAYVRENSVLPSADKSAMPELVLKDLHRPGALAEFLVEPPQGTKELWVGTPYAKWIERDVRFRLSKERDDELERLRTMLEEENQRRVVVEQQLAEAQHRIDVEMPGLKAKVCETKENMLRHVEKGALQTIFENTKMLAEACFRLWQIETYRSNLRSARGLRPDIRGCRQEMQEVMHTALLNWTNMQEQITEISMRYMDLDSYQGGKPPTKSSRSLSNTMVVENNHTSIEMNDLAVPGFGTT